MCASHVPATAFPATAFAIALAIVLMSLGLGASPARADCFHNGGTVADGTQVGGLICQNGQWTGG